VRGAHRERRWLLERQPHLTYWCPIAVPINSWISSPAPFGHPLFAFAPFMLVRSCSMRARLLRPFLRSPTRRGGAGAVNAAW
jgi:hypothetical protein